MVSMWNWVMHWTGLDDGSGAWYLFWSGIVGDLALLGGIIAAFRIVNCHVSGCYRVGLHHVDGTPYRTCTKHHPSTPGSKGEVTVEHIHEAHRRALEA